MGEGLFHQMKQTFGLVKREEEIENHTFQIEHIQKIIIEACAVDIFVDTHNEPCVDLEFQTFENGPEMDITHTDNELHIHVQQVRKRFNVDTQEATLMIKAPPEMAEEWKIRTTSRAIQLRNIKTSCLDVQVSSGEIDCKTIQAEEIIVEATSGNIVMEQIAAGSVHATISSGVIELTGIRCSQIHTFTTSGTVDMQHIVSKVCTGEASSGDVRCAHMQSEHATLQCSSGLIHLRDVSMERLKVTLSSGDFSAVNLRTSSAHIEATSGDLFTKLDPSMTDYELEGVASSGDVFIDLLIDFKVKRESHVLGSVGTGEKDLCFRTTSGDVNVRS